MPTIEQLEKLLNADPDDTFVLYGLAQAHAAEGEHETAVEFYRRCLRVDPGYSYAFYHQARSLEALGRRDEAAEVLRDGAETAARVGDAKARSEIDAYLAELGEG